MVLIVFKVKVYTQEGYTTERDYIQSMYWDTCCLRCWRGRGRGWRRFRIGKRRFLSIRGRTLRAEEPWKVLRNNGRSLHCILSYWFYIKGFKVIINSILVHLSLVVYPSWVYTLTLKTVKNHVKSISFWARLPFILIYCRPRRKIKIGR